MAQETVKLSHEGEEGRGRWWRGDKSMGSGWEGQLRSCPRGGQGLLGKMDMVSNTNDLILEVKCTRETGTLQIKRAQDDRLASSRKPQVC